MAYFTNLPPDELVQELKKRFADYQKWLQESGFASRILASYSQYYGLGKKGSMGVEKSEDGTICYVNVNHHRNLLVNQKQMITSNKLSFFARARVSDSDALAASVLGKSVIDYYTEELKLSKQLAKLVEIALVCQQGSVGITWNPGKGKLVRPDESNNRIYSGDVQLDLYTPFDVAKSTKVSSSPYKITRQLENRWDLIALHPEHAEYLENYQETADPKETFSYPLNFDAQTNESDEDQVFSFTFYHHPSPACPDGMVVKYVGDQIIEMDDLLTRYESIPVFELSAGDVISSVAAHGTSIDLLPLQEVISALFTAVVTNNINLALVNVYAKDPNTKKIQLGEGMNLWTGTEPPTALSLANSSPETYSLINLLIGQANMVAGANDVTRGTVSNTKLTSGNALALLLSQAIAFVSDIQRDYSDLASDVASQIIRNIRLNAKTKMVVALSGKTNRTYSKSFQGEDLLGVDKIMCELQNPVMATQAGRTQVADSLLANNMLDSGEDYVAVLTTGDLPSATDGALSLKQGIAEENERLKDGEQVPVLISDRHDLHFKSHISQLNDPETRKRPELVSNILQHAQQHIELWKQMPIEMMMLLGMQPPPQQQMPAPEQGQGDVPMPSEESGMPSMPSLPGQAPEEAQASYDSFQQDLPPMPNQQ